MFLRNRANYVYSPDFLAMPIARYRLSGNVGYLKEVLHNVRDNDCLPASCRPINYRRNYFRHRPRLDRRCSMSKLIDLGAMPIFNEMSEKEILEYLNLQLNKPESVEQIVSELISSGILPTVKEDMQ